MTSLELLKQWVQSGETETQEFKKTTGQRSDGVRTVCGMLNQRGGRVIFGVDPKGNILGQETSDKTTEDLVAELRHIDPPVIPTVEMIPVDARKNAILISVSRGEHRPFAYKGKAYIRVGNTTSELSTEQRNRMILERFHSQTRWENEIAEGFTVDDLDTNELLKTMEEAIRRGRSEDPGTREPLEILRGLGLLSRDGQILRAALVLFGRDESFLPNFPQCKLRLAKFRGVDKTEFVDNRQIHGHAFDLLKKAERFLSDNLPVAGRIIPSLFERIDDPLYPRVALREALANAFCHRDYSIGGGSVAVAIFDNRLEITSSGDLHFGIKPEDLYKPHESIPWNPIIANVFYRRGIIEAWGMGTIKMVELTRKAGLPRPDIETISGAVTVRFLPSHYIPPQRVGHDLSVQQQNILRVIGQYRSLALGEVETNLLDMLGNSVERRSIRSDLYFLRDIGLIRHNGVRGRGARWLLAEDDAS